MKRPNVRKMQRHRARSVPDRMRARFDLDYTRSMDEQPEVRAFVDKFIHNMHLKHGHRPEIGVFINECAGRYPGQFELEVEYKGPATVQGYIKTFNENIMTPAEIRRRML